MNEGAFVRAWREGNPVARAALKAPPLSDDEWRACVVDAPSRPWSRLEAEALAARQRVVEAGPRAEAMAIRLTSPGARVVVTGQQPSPYGGALLAVHKAATTIALAHKLNELAPELDVIPCFWLASDDHDVDEVRGVTVHNGFGSPQRLRLALPADRRSIHHQPFSSEAKRELHQAICAALPDTDRAHLALDAVKPRSEESYTAWIARCLALYLGDSGLVMLEPEHLQAHMAREIPRLVQDAALIASALRDAGDRQEHAGLPRPLPKDQANVPVFVRTTPTGPRTRVTQADAAKACMHLETEPWRASVDVVGRVLVQNAILPVAVHVVGPTEMAYVAQIGAAAAKRGDEFPLVVPRAHATWMDSKTTRRLHTMNATLEDVLAMDAPPPETQERGPNHSLEVLDKLHEDFAAFIASADDDLGDVSGNALHSMWNRRRAELEKRWAGVHAALRKAVDQDQGVGRAQWQRLRDALAPMGKPQERVICPLSFAVRYGFDAVGALLAALEPCTSSHQLAVLRE